MLLHPATDNDRGLASNCNVALVLSGRCGRPFPVNGSILYYRKPWTLPFAPQRH